MAQSPIAQVTTPIYPCGITKTQLLIHDFNDAIITDTKHNLKIIVTDNVGNSSTFETTFYRK